MIQASKYTLRASNEYPFLKSMAYLQVLPFHCVGGSLSVALDPWIKGTDHGTAFFEHFFTLW